MLLKQKSPSLPRNLALKTFGELLIMFSKKVNLLYLLYSSAQRCCLLHLIKQNCLLKTFLRTLILMTWVSLYQFSLLELIWSCESELSYILAELFNIRLKVSCFPDCWKVSFVVPVFKNVGGRSTAKDYCLVSLLFVLSKVFEKLVYNR